MTETKKETKTKYTYRFTTPGEVGYLYVQWKRSKRNYETFSEHQSKSDLLHAKHNTKYITT
jgi:hypothetical protein